MATYAATDLHGMYNLWEQIKEYMKPEDTLYYLGDAIDRGPRGWDVFTELLDDPRVIFIKGNHEDMMYNSYALLGELGTEYFKAWDKNGGKETRKNLQEKNLSYLEKMEYIYKIKDMPTFRVYKNEREEIFLLTHAGFTPTKEYWNLNLFEQEYSNLWNRKHITERWPQDAVNENKFVIHGHTPIPYMFQLIPGIQDPVFYCGGHKVNLDTGAFSSNIAILYNLDKNDIEIYFKGE